MSERLEDEIAYLSSRALYKSTNLYLYLYIIEKHIIANVESVYFWL